MDFDHILHWIFIFMSIAVTSYAIGTLIIGINDEINYRKQRRINNGRRNSENDE
jgi:hypothetical protein